MSDIYDALGGEFTPDTIDGADSFEPLPAGWYAVGIEDAELKTTKAGTGKFIKLEMSVIDGQYKGRKLFHNINIVNPNQQAADIGIRDLARLGKAIGLMSINDTAQLIDSMVQVKLKVEAADEEKGYDAGNAITGFKAMDSAKPTTTASAAPAPRAQQQELAPAAAPAPAAPKTAPAASAPARKRPWDK
jgi:hypothetical protein